MGSAEPRRPESCVSSAPAANSPIQWPFARWRDDLYRTAWVVYAKRPFGGPEQVIEYLSRYTHRVAISSSRIVEMTDERIVIKTRDGRTAAMEPSEFIRRFLLHVLPHQFRKIRHYGLLAPANVGTRLKTAHRLLDAAGHPYNTRIPEPGELIGEPIEKPIVCPSCGSANIRRDRLPPSARGPPEAA